MKNLFAFNQKKTLFTIMMVMFLWPALSKATPTYTHYTNYTETQLCRVSIPAFKQNRDTIKNIVAKFSTVQSQELQYFFKLNDKVVRVKTFSGFGGSETYPLAETDTLVLSEGRHSIKIKSFEYGNSSVKFHTQLKGFQCNKGQILYLFVESEKRESGKQLQKVAHIVDAQTKKILWKGRLEHQDGVFTADLTGVKL
ncbi:MAG: hypothetical protein QNL04_07400 [SAR324 cluster bacterium]|nr:hypothetical protein [SAR324 cluster bacterium]